MTLLFESGISNLKNLTNQLLTLFLAGGFFYPADGDDTLLRNNGSHKLTRSHIQFFTITVVKDSNPTISVQLIRIINCNYNFTWYWNLFVGPLFTFHGSQGFHGTPFG
jgi:hypothetical protein